MPSFVSWLVSVLRRPRKRVSAAARRELRGSLLRTGFYLLLIFALHSAAMQAFEGMRLSDAVWLTLTTVTTVGYGDLSAATPLGRAATVVLLYIGGIFALAKIAGDYFDYRAERRLRKLRGEWDWNMRGHILIINMPARDGEQYFVRLIQEFRASASYRDHAVQMLTTGFPDALPESLARLGNVVHFHGRADDPESLEATNAHLADAIVVLAKDDHDPTSDSTTFAILHRLAEAEVKGTILAECVDDRNRARLLDAGANMVTRPIRAYPGMIVRGFVAPGSEQIIENMFSSASDEYRRFDVAVSEVDWKDIVCRVINHDLGTAVAYVSATDGVLNCNPPAHTRVNAKALILMVREDNKPTLTRVEHALQAGA